MNQLEKVLYTAKTHTTGGRENGAARSADGLLDVRLSAPGSARIGTNPEQLFAAGWSACFESAMALVAGKKKIALPADLAKSLGSSGLLQGIGAAGAAMASNAAGAAVTQTRAASASSGFPMWAIVVVVLIILAALYWFFVMKKEEPKPAAEAPATIHYAAPRGASVRSRMIPSVATI